MRYTRMLMTAGLALALTVSGPAMAIRVGQKVPEAAGIVLQGPPGIRLSSLQGKVVVVDFWASWCAPCIETMPKIEALHQHMKEQGYGDRFTVLSVSIDDDMVHAQRFLAVHPVSYPVVVDTIGFAVRNFNLWRLPATFIVRADGQIDQIYYGFGETFAGDIEKRVLALLRSGH